MTVATRFTGTLLPGNDDDLRTALQDVNLPNILMVVAHLTGDSLWLSPRYSP